MTMRNVIWGGLFVLTVCLNAYLWFTRSNLPSPDRPTLKARPKQYRPRGLPEFKWTPRRPVPGAYANDERAVLERRLVEIEARLQELLPSNEKFALAERSPEVEKVVKPYLDQVFKPLVGSEPKYRVECRGHVCKFESPLEDALWRKDLQLLYPGREMFSSMSFGVAGTFLEYDLGPPDGKRVIGGILLNALGESSCGLSSAKGTLRVTFSLDTYSRTIRVATDGSLATHEVGLCVRKAIEDTILRGYVSPNLTSLPSEPIELL